MDRPVVVYYILGSYFQVTASLYIIYSIYTSIYILCILDSGKKIDIALYYGDNIVYTFLDIGERRYTQWR